MEAEVSELTGRAQGRARPGAPADLPQRVPRPPLGHPGGHHRPRDPAGPRRLVLPVACSSRGGGPSGPCSRSSRRRTCWASAPAGSTTSSGPWASRAISQSEVSRICAALDAEVAAFRGRSLAGEAYPYLWLDATYLKVREAGRVVSMAALVATGVALTGERRVLGLELAAGNDEGSAWPALHPLARRARPPRASASSSATTTRASSRPSGSSSWARRWQRCRVHFTRNAQDLVPRSARSMVASAIRAVFEQPDEASARRAARPGHRQPAAALPGGRRAARRRRARPARPLHVPRDPPPPDPLHQPARAAQQGDQAPDRGRRHLPEPGARHPPRRHGPRRAGRRVAGRPALLPARDDGRASTPSSTRGGGPGAAAWRADRSGARTTRCYTTCWDLTTPDSLRSQRRPDVAMPE